MPSKSRAQQRLFQAAEHGANFPMAKKVRESMSHEQMHDFAVGKESNKPMHVNKEPSAGHKMHPEHPMLHRDSFHKNEHHG